MSTKEYIPKTLQEAILYFANEDTCVNVLAGQRWPDGVVCPYCEGREISALKCRRVWQCRSCRKEFSIKLGTFMEDSPIKLSKWFLAMWMVANCKNGVSSYEIHRAIGVTQKSAWFMLHRIRLAFTDHQATDLAGTVEADETGIGGLERFKHKNKKQGGSGYVGKVAVQAFLERGDDGKLSRARAHVLTNPSGPGMKRAVRTHVQPGSIVYTDSAPQYQGLDRDYIHEFVNHAVEYVRDNVHTNGLENFFALLKRMIRGTYVAITAEHLDAYLTEQVFRFNERHDDDGGRFGKVIGGIRGKRLTYKQLTGSFSPF